MFKIAKRVINKSACNSLVGGVTPGCRIRRRSAKHSDGQTLVNAIAEVSPVYGAQTRRVRKVKPSDAHRNDCVGILVIKSQMVRSVQQFTESQRGDAAQIAWILRRQVPS